MAIPREYATSNPMVRDALSAIPATYRAGTPTGDFVAPDIRIDAEAVDYLVEAEQNLDLDDLRAADAEAKEVRFAQGTSGSLSVVERAKKTHVDTRKIEDAGRYGIDILAQRGDLLRADILDAKEYRIATLVTTAASFAAGHKDVSGLNFRTGDLQTLADGWNNTIADDGGFQARRGIIGKTAWLHVRKNATFREFAGGSDATATLGDLSLAAFAEFIGLDEVRIGNYKRKIGNATTATQFWPVDSFLMFAQNDTVGTNTFAATPVVPYGPEFGSNGQLVDVRTEPMPGTERRTEVGVYHRYRPVGRNWSLAFLVTGIVGV
jgi:hypothetical protein